MLKDNSIPIRLDTATKERLKAAAERVGVTPSALIRILIVSFVESFEHSDGRLTLPLEWDSSAPPPFRHTPPLPRARRYP